MSDYEMPLRDEHDGSVSIDRPNEGRIGIHVNDYGENSYVVMSEYNAWRVFGLLSAMLGLPLAKSVSKAIKL